jgi:hypothetical protein
MEFPRPTSLPTATLPAASAKSGIRRGAAIDGLRPVRRRGADQVGPPPATATLAVTSPQLHQVQAEAEAWALRRGGAMTLLMCAVLAGALLLGTLTVLAAAMVSGRAGHAAWA